MSTISECQHEINRYIALRNNINAILSYLNESINSSNITKNNIINNYLINDESTPVVSRIDKLNNNMKNTYNTLKGTISGINTSIASLKAEIARLEAEESE